VNEQIRLLPGQRLDEVADPDPETQEQAIVNRERARRRRELLARPPLERRVLSWRYGLADGGELSVRQVARRLNTSVGSAWNIEQRALQMLRASYGVEAAA
jgi:DNA-directed RNA polymerase sigma subunit (sigma70/sigma32)